MPDTPASPSDIFFSPAVKAVQARRGSRQNYAEMAAGGSFRSALTTDVAGWIAERDSFYLGTASADGQPYIQHRGGPPGFIHVLDSTRLAWADYRGNRQYITLGNLSENLRVTLFFMDYEERHRLKVWGTARAVEREADPAFVASLMPPGYRAVAEQAIVVTVTAWDANCPQHIPRKFDAARVVETMTGLQTRVAELEAELARLRAEKA